ncbi:MAG: hypothetical protein IH831_06490 [Planctomycetes bacterium]|nr:hypothetical protein [Planctomycetota bacterium]
MATAGTTWLHRMGTRAIDLLFPPSCVACGVGMGELVDDVAMCTTCRDALPRIAWATCQRCAARVPEIPGCVPDCKHCRDHRIRFDRTFALGAYDGLLRDLVLEMHACNQSVQPVYATIVDSNESEPVLQTHLFHCNETALIAVVENWAIRQDGTYRFALRLARVACARVACARVACARVACARIA